ncbi:MAG: hypothetical protein MZU91_02070 [Desulfosudis oleivorans]|nr:hypothetical protein [Desulfosudis oleivorans]
MLEAIVSTTTPLPQIEIAVGEKLRGAVLRKSHKDDYVVYTPKNQPALPAEY